MLAGTLDTSGQGLVDIDDLNAGLVLGVLEVEGDGGDGEGLAGDPAHALEGEDLGGVIGEGLGLHFVKAVVSEFVAMRRRSEMRCGAGVEQGRSHVIAGR